MLHDACGTVLVSWRWAGQFVGWVRQPGCLVVIGLIVIDVGRSHLLDCRACRAQKILPKLRAFSPAVRQLLQIVNLARIRGIVRVIWPASGL